MFERLHNTEETFDFKLGSALTMERNVLEMLGDLERKSHSDQLKQQFRHHADETRQQIDNIVESFRARGKEPDDSPCLVIHAIDTEARANIARADDDLVDDVILSGAAETEHFEIAMYETLITHAQALGATQVVGLLSQNLEQEQHTLDEVRRASQQIVQQQVAHAG
jgi:ferritin-like metal-binding protein YciE